MEWKRNQFANKEPKELEYAVQCRIPKINRNDLFNRLTLFTSQNLSHSDLLQLNVRIKRHANGSSVNLILFYFTLFHFIGFVEHATGRFAHCTLHTARCIVDRDAATRKSKIPTV